MKKKIIIISSFLTIMIIACGIYFLYRNEDNKVNIKVKEINVNESKTTQVYAIQNIPMENKNMIWCGTINLAWNELRDNMIKEDIKLQGEETLSKELNKKPFTKDSLNDKDYIAMVGYKKDDIVNKINKALKDKFKEDDMWKVDVTLQNPEDILAYSFLKKSISFKNAFEVLENGMDFKGKNVLGFGIDKFDESKKDKLREQIEVLSYNNEDDFIIELKGDNSEDEIVLAKVPPKGTFKETLDYGLTNRKKLDGYVEVKKLKIPKIAFRADKNFTELEDKQLLNRNFQGYSIEKVIQKTEFTLTEKGAILKSKAEIAMEKSCSKTYNLNLIFDKPFLIYMKEKNKDKPYFALWVYDTELMMDK